MTTKGVHTPRILQSFTSVNGADSSVFTRCFTLPHESDEVVFFFKSLRKLPISPDSKNWDLLSA